MNILSQLLHILETTIYILSMIDNVNYAALKFLCNYSDVVK